MHMRDHRGKFGAVSLGLTLWLCCSQGHVPLLQGIMGILSQALSNCGGAAAGTGPGGHLYPLPTQTTAQTPPGPPSPLLVPFSLQHERARGLRACRCHRLHQHQLTEVCGVEMGPSPRGANPLPGALPLCFRGAPRPPSEPSPTSPA